MHAELDDLLVADLVEVPDEQLRAGLLALVALDNRVQAAIAAFVTAFDRRDLSTVDACKTTAVWLRGSGPPAPPAAPGVVRRARLLSALPALASAAAAGDVSAEHLTPIGHLVTDVGIDQVTPADQILADAASALESVDLGRVCGRIRDHVDPDGPAPTQLFEKRELTLADAGGMVSVRGQLDPEGGAALREAIDALMKPPPPDDERTAA